MVPCIICTHLNLHLSLNRKSTVGWVGGKRRNWKESIRVRVSVMYVCTDMYVQYSVHTISYKKIRISHR